MGLETEPDKGEDKPKQFNKCDEAHGTLCFSISPDLLFHIESLDTPNKIWTKIETLFGTQDSMTGHMLENELISLSPGNFNTIQDFFTKLKSLRLQLKQCGIEKKDEQLILSILSKLTLEYSVFVSTLYTTKGALGTQFTMPSLDDFAVNITQEQDKLIQMGTLMSSKSHALATNQGTKEQKGQSSNNNSKDDKKNNSEEKKNQISISSIATIHTPSSKGDKPKKEKVKCAYGKRPGHDEHKFLKKEIDHLTYIIEKNNISVPESIKQSSNERSNKEKENNKGKEKGKTLVAVASSPSTRVFDLGPLHHMALSKEEIASLEPCTMPSILMGDDTPSTLTLKSL